MMWIIWIQCGIRLSCHGKKLNGKNTEEKGSKEQHQERESFYANDAHRRYIFRVKSECMNVGIKTLATKIFTKSWLN